MEFVVQVPQSKPEIVLPQQRKMAIFPPIWVEAVEEPPESAMALPLWLRNVEMFSLQQVKFGIQASLPESSVVLLQWKNQLIFPAQQRSPQSLSFPPTLYLLKGFR